MKNTILLLCLSFVASSAMATDIDSTGLEGDNLDLNAVLEIFKESDSPEDFEKRLNSEGTNVNNLDLNEDGEVDYIRVIDSGDSTSHALTLQVSVNETESQDIAVIEIEETSEDSVQMQVLADVELYGDNYILVPQEKSKSSSVTIVNVRNWRPIRHMYGPKYVFYVSPWRYKHHPKWYRPWKRVKWNVYHGRVVHHHGHCRRVRTPQFHRAHHHYHRTHSAHFHTAHHHKHGKVVGKSTPGGKISGTKEKAPASKKAPTSPATKQAAKPAGQKKQVATNKSTASPKKSATPRQAAPQPNERKRPGAHSTPGKTKTKGSSTKKNPAQKHKSSGGKGGKKRN
ncbi:MAG: hypothetical protein HRT57_10730 [Crocinitomicaceae bacterium]|nr:hypothetical protein [Crocinitomicaceae bacterium]